MQRNDLPVLFQELRKLCAIHNRDFNEMLGMAYAETLKDVSLDVIVANARAAREGDRFPLPKDLMATPDAESPEIAAARAWELTRPHFARHTEPADPIAREVVRLLGGSAHIGGKDSDEVGTWIRRDFLKLYVDLSKDERRRATVERLLDQGAVRGVHSGDVTKLNAGDFRAALIEPKSQYAPAPAHRTVPTRAKWLEPGHQVKDRRGIVVATVGDLGGYVQCVAKTVVFMEFTKSDGNAVRELCRQSRRPNGGAA